MNMLCCVSVVFQMFCCMLCEVCYWVVVYWCFFFFKQKTAYEMRISDWSSDVCSSDLLVMSSAPTCVCGPIPVAHPWRCRCLLRRIITKAAVRTGAGGLDRKSVV